MSDIFAFGFQLVVSLAGIAMGFVALFFTRWMNDAQIRFFSQQKDPLGHEMAKGLARPHVYFITKLVGGILIIFFTYYLVTLFAT